MNFFAKFFVLLFFSALFASCSTLKGRVMDSASNMLAGADKKGVPIESKKNSPDPMLAFMGEKDPKIIQEVLPLLVKMYEIMAIENPVHQGIQIMAGQFNIMYGNLCVQTPADRMTVDKLDEQVAEYNRAKYHYLKGRKYILDAYEERWQGFTKDFLSSDMDIAKAAAQKITKDDVNSAYWAAAASLLYWSLDPIDVDALSSIAGPVALLEKAAELDPDYSNGAIWDALSQFYAAAPMDFGGDNERALYCHKQAMRASGGKSPGIYVTYAESFCKPSADRDGYIKALEAALAIDPDMDENTRLMSVINQQKAQYLLDHVDDYFVIW